MAPIIAAKNAGVEIPDVLDGSPMKQRNPFGRNGWDDGTRTTRGSGRIVGHAEVDHKLAWRRRHSATTGTAVDGILLSIPSAPQFR